MKHRILAVLFGLAAACVSATAASAATYTITLKQNGSTVGSGTFIAAGPGSTVTQMSVVFGGDTYSVLNVSPTAPQLQQVGANLGLAGLVSTIPFNNTTGSPFGRTLFFDTFGGSLVFLTGFFPCIDCEAVPGGEYSIALDQTVVPIPAAAPLFATALAAGAFVRRRK